jgi:hypothetical protein
MTKQKEKTPKYQVIEKYIKCVVTDSEGRHVLAGASQKTLKHLYETGHEDKISKNE